MPIAIKRLTKELSNLMNEDLDDFKILDSNDIMNWKASIYGQKNSIFDGGKYDLEIKFSLEYPTKPPSVKFLTPIFHPNVYKDGRICVDILQSEWTPSLNVNSILISLRSLLLDPNNNSPANRDAANLLRKNPSEYSSKVQEMISQRA